MVRGRKCGGVRRHLQRPRGLQPLERDLLLATAGDAVLRIVTNWGAGAAPPFGQLHLRFGTFRDVDTFGVGKSFLILPRCSLVTKIVEFAKNADGLKGADKMVWIWIWRRYPGRNGNGAAPHALATFLIKSFRHFVVSTNILISRQKPFS